MAESQEGIGGRKWSLAIGEDRHGFGCECDGDPLLRECEICGPPNPPVQIMQGVTRICSLYDLPKDPTTGKPGLGDEHVKHLLVTAPQLWDAANELIKELATLPTASLFLHGKDQTLKNMVAKAVGKTDWKDVKQRG